MYLQFSDVTTVKKGQNLLWRELINRSITEGLGVNDIGWHPRYAYDIQLLNVKSM